MEAADYQHADPKWVKWVKEQPEARECLFCTNAATDWCHVEHGSSRCSDFVGYPACNDHHIMLDHAPRGSHSLVKESTVRRALAYWFTFELSALIARYTELCESSG